MRIVAVTGDLRALLNDLTSDVAAAARQAVTGASERLQADLRQQVRAAGLGVGLEKAWRMEIYPQTGRRTLRPAGLVYSKARRLHEAFEAGETVTVQGDRWLVLPLPAAKAAGLDRMLRKGDNDHPNWNGRAKWSDVGGAGRLRFVRTKPNQALLIPEGRRNGPRPEPLFLLVKQRRGRKLLDIDGAAERAKADLHRSLSNILGG